MAIEKKSLISSRAAVKKAIIASKGTPLSKATHGIGLNKAGVGLNKAGVGLNKSGVGLNKAGVGLNKAGVGLNKAGVGLNKAGVGLNKAGVGLNKAGVGLNKAGVGLNKAGVGTQQGWRWLEQGRCGTQQGWRWTEQSHLLRQAGSQQRAAIFAALLCCPNLLPEFPASEITQQEPSGVGQGTPAHIDLCRSRHAFAQLIIRVLYRKCCRKITRRCQS